MGSGQGCTHVAVSSKRSAVLELRSGPSQAPTRPLNDKASKLIAIHDGSLYVMLSSRPPIAQYAVRNTGYFPGVLLSYFVKGSPFIRGTCGQRARDRLSVRLSTDQRNPCTTVSSKSGVCLSHFSRSPSLHHSITPPLHYSMISCLHYSITQSLHHSTTTSRSFNTSFPRPRHFLIIIMIIIIVIGAADHICIKGERGEWGGWLLCAMRGWLWKTRRSGEEGADRW